MFSREHWQIKLVYSGFGALLLFIGLLLPPVTAQRDKFDQIECRGLKVVDGEGRSLITLNDSLVVFRGSIIISGENPPGMPAGILSLRGGHVWVLGKDGKSVELGIDKHSGFVQIDGKGESKVAILINEHGGVVAAHGKDGKSIAELGVDEDGGFVTVKGKGEGSVAIGINEYGNGAVSTRDKNGYRQK